MSVENIVVDIEINNSIAPDIEQSIVATIDNNINVIKDNTDDLDVTINRKEYVITGDEIYIPKRYEDAPTWLQNMIDQVVEYSIGAKVSDMNQVVYSLNQMIEAMEVSKNTYEMSVISSNDIDTRINTAITTLNSNMNDADATILSVANTKTTPEEAEAIMINAVRAELERTEAGTIGAAVATLSTAIANESEARSTSVETLYSTIEGEFEATATAFNTINTYIGIDEAGASTGTGLSAYLEDSNGNIGGADSKVVNNVYVDALGNAKSKFEYGSIVAVNGINHIAGFGLSNSTGTDIGSEFWINAAKFKFTNNNKTGSKSPFTIDATGTVPEITFNGKVSFNNVTDYTPPDISGTINNNNDAFARRLGYLSYADMVAAAESGQTIINGGYLRGELIEANSINAGQIDAYAIVGKHISGGTITGTHIIGSVIKSSFIDLTSSLALTNWQYYTPATIPVGYEQNFAHTNEGNLVVDSQGYVRLAGQQNFIIPAIAQKGTLWNGSLKNVTTSPSVTINKVWELYSWAEYKVDTLQRSLRNDTQFSSNSSLIFKGEIVCESPLGGPGTNVNNYSTYSLRFLNTDIVVSILASNGGQHNAEITNIQFNGATVAYADGKSGKSKGSDSAFVDYHTTIKGVPVNIKTTFTGMAGFTFVFTATISNSTTIIGHTIDDIIKINSVSHSLNTANSSAAGQTTVTYEINFPSTWVV